MQKDKSFINGKRAAKKPPVSIFGESPVSKFGGSPAGIFGVSPVSNFGGSPAGIYGESDVPDTGVRYEPDFGSSLAYAAAKSAMRNNISTLPGTARKPDRISGIAEKLADILECEAILYKDAGEISAKKTDVIVRGKIEDLDCLVKAEQSIIVKIGKLEDEREKIVEALSAELGLELENATLSDISSHFDDRSHERLKACQNSLSRTLGDLKNSNDMNSQLIQNALDYVNFSVNLITTNQNSTNTYTHDGGEIRGNHRRSVFDVKL